MYHVASILLHPRILYALLVCCQLSLKVVLFVCRELQVLPRKQPLDRPRTLLDRIEAVDVDDRRLCSMRAVGSQSFSRLVFEAGARRLGVLVRPFIAHFLFSHSMLRVRMQLFEVRPFVERLGCLLTFKDPIDPTKPEILGPSCPALPAASVARGLGLHIQFVKLPRSFG